MPRLLLSLLGFSSLFHFFRRTEEALHIEREREIEKYKSQQTSNINSNQQKEKDRWNLFLLAILYAHTQLNPHNSTIRCPDLSVLTVRNWQLEVSDWLRWIVYYFFKYSMQSICPSSCTWKIWRTNLFACFLWLAFEFALLIVVVVLLLLFIYISVSLLFTIGWKGGGKKEREKESKSHG